MDLSKALPRRSNFAVFFVLGCAAFALTLYASAPGYMSVDSGTQLDQARSLQLRDDHPVAVALIWHVTDRIVPGPLGMLVLMTGLYWAGLSMIFAVLRGPTALRALGLLLVGFYPPAAANLPAIWKDNLMQGALIAGAACLAVAGTRWRPLRLSLAMLFFLVAIGARHNAAAGVWPFLILPLLALPGMTQAPILARWLAAGITSLVITLVLTIGLGKALAPLATKTEFWQMIPVFDLAGMSLAVDKVLVEPDSGVLTAGMGLREIRYKFNPVYSNSLYYCLPFAGQRCVPLFRRTLDADKLGHLSRNWWRAVTTHPAAYVAHRAKICAALLGISGGAKGSYYPGGAPWTENAREYQPPRRVQRLLGWIDSQVPTFWFRPWLYAGLCLLLVPLGMRRYAGGASPLPILFAVSGLSYALSFMISTGSADYRYTVWTTSCSVLSLASLVLPLLARQRGDVPRRRVLAERKPLDADVSSSAAELARAGGLCPDEASDRLDPKSYSRISPPGVY
jgi:hypothetical protein